MVGFDPLLDVIGLGLRFETKTEVFTFAFDCSSLTFEGVRRLLEKDLGLETFSLDVHKRFIKQLLHEVLLWILHPLSPFAFGFRKGKLH